MNDQLQEDGYCIIADVLAPKETCQVREALLAAADESERRGVPTFIPQLDPNASNVRVFNLIDLDAVFRELILHPAAKALVEEVVGPYFMISNFTANIARPGSGSMAVHSDLAIVMPEPWLAPWSVNIIWCLDDVDEENGATLFLPGSHRITSMRDLPQRPIDHMRPFKATAGSIIAMDGRVWHTSGKNRSRNRERALLFGYYSADFIRPQVNWNATLSPETIASLSPALFDRLGLGPAANVRHGATITTAGS